MNEKQHENIQYSKEEVSKEKVGGEETRQEYWEAKHTATREVAKTKEKAYGISCM